MNNKPFKDLPNIKLDQYIDAVTLDVLIVRIWDKVDDKTKAVILQTLKDNFVEFVQRKDI